MSLEKKTDHKTTVNDSEMTVGTFHLLSHYEHHSKIDLAGTIHAMLPGVNVKIFANNLNNHQKF